ncbi:MAG: hypothetical protein LBE21_06060, partial [Pseudomonadales bacterium]|nr:hypothetical protein [Pseudomonadales bacterium]
MKHLVLFILGILGLIITPNAVLASSDYVCEPSWAPPSSSISFNSCGNGAMLSPNNDTRVNLLFLQRAEATPFPQVLDDAVAPQDAEWTGLDFGKSIFSWDAVVRSHLPEDEFYARFYIFEGSRCGSLDSGREAFTLALAANAQVSETDRAALLQARGNLARHCPNALEDGAVTGVWPDALSGMDAQFFLNYLQGADAFYAGNWDGARRIFEDLRAASDEWLAQTAAYMLIRVELNVAQESGFDGYGYFFGVADPDHPAAIHAQEAISAYLTRYPTGSYAESARGLRRRALWLAGDYAALAGEYEALLDSIAPDTQDALALMQEIDNTLFFPPANQAVEAAQLAQTPRLLAVHDLSRLRKPDEQMPAPLSRAELASQAPLFAQQPALYDYLVAAHTFYAEQDYRQVLSFIPETDAASNTPLAFSRQMLRGMALAALNDPAEETHWRTLLQGTLAPYQRELAELGLAVLWQREGNLSAIFAPDSPVRDATLRKIVLSRKAGPELLRAVVADTGVPPDMREVALFTLLQRNLLTGHYADFLKDQALTSNDNAAAAYWQWYFPFDAGNATAVFTTGIWVGVDGYACPALLGTAGALARNPADAAALLCLADFWRLNGFDDFYALQSSTSEGALGAGPSEFPGQESSRASIYAAVVADPRASADDKAYALYR